MSVIQHLTCRVTIPIKVAVKVHMFYYCLFVAMVTVGCNSEQSDQVINPDSKAKSSPLPPASTETSISTEISTHSNEPDAKGVIELPSTDNGNSSLSPKYNIFRSAGTGDIDAVKYHLANQVKLNTQDKTGKTPLLWAIRSKEHEIVYYLLDNVWINHGAIPSNPNYILRIKFNRSFIISF